MEIRLGTIEDRFPKDSAKIDFQDLLTKREFIAMEKAISQINKYKSHKRLIEIVLLNNEEIEVFFQEAFSRLINKSVSWTGIKNDEMENIFLHANRLLLNYLSSIRTYIDHTSTFLAREYGKASTQVKKFEQLLSFNFDNNFCYRFFYKLRNYSQHCGVPIDSLNYTNKYDRENKKVHGHLMALFKPETLLKNYDSWGIMVKNDLTNMKEAFELTELRESMTAIMYNINYNFEKINYPKTKKAAIYISKKINHLTHPEKEPCIFYNVQTNDEGHVSNFEIISIPLKEVQKTLLQ